MPGSFYRTGIFMTDTTTYSGEDLDTLVSSAPALSPADLDQLRRLLAPVRKVTRSDVELAA